MALAERMVHARWPDLTDHWTYVIAGDGCLMEGISHEAIDVHGAPLGTDEIAAARKRLDWPHDPFVLPADVTAAWATIAARGAEVRAT